MKVGEDEAVSSQQRSDKIRGDAVFSFIDKPEARGREWCEEATALIWGQRLDDCMSFL